MSTRLTALVVLAGGILLQFFTILSGAVNRSPINQFYFLEASTTDIPNARNPSRWTFFAICGVDDGGHNSNCGNVVPALPFDPPRNFRTDVNVPAQFIGTNQYFYLSRFMFAFYLIALFFAVVALFTGLLALCSRLGDYLSALTIAVALFFQTLTAALMTAWIVKGRNAFRSAGLESNVGVKLIAFTWAAMACFVISSVLFCCGGVAGRDTSSVRRKRSTRSNRSRGSFLDTESQRRVKDDYS
ncbi:SUR7-domain-containing protein [Lentithecium fluviatile CBS 122367]|uniref:SUR7-domain-containing protein n=1 Tax=Lentithecium fluviatile CBS 122367 TaxID=1168545 RepID=A0A6G1JM02_9PLEO|nr:SUR7-domain-containing protein [Lentithecium fluviatile CBS 122367]